MHCVCVCVWGGGLNKWIKYLYTMSWRRMESAEILEVHLGLNTPSVTRITNHQIMECLKAMNLNGYERKRSWTNLSFCPDNSPERPRKTITYQRIDGLRYEISTRVSRWRSSNNNKPTVTLIGCGRGLILNAHFLSVIPRVGGWKTVGCETWSGQSGY